MSIKIYSTLHEFCLFFHTVSQENKTTAPKTRTHTKELKGLLPIERPTHHLKELLVGLVKELVEFVEDGGGHVWVGSALGVV